MVIFVERYDSLIISLLSSKGIGEVEERREKKHTGEGEHTGKQ